MLPCGLFSRNKQSNPKPMGLSPYVTVKDLASLMQLSPRTVKKKAKLLGFPPSVNDHACMRWNFRQASRLLRAWENNQTLNHHET